MTGSHEVGGSIPPGSTRDQTPRAPFGAPRRLLLGLLLAPPLAALAYAAFVLDAGVWCKADTPQDGVCTWGYWIARLQWWPFGRTQDLGWLPSWLVRDLGFRVVHPSFWIAATWAGAVTVGAALVAPGAGPRRRASLPWLVGVTVLAVFVVPEVVHPVVADLLGGPASPYVALPWPLALAGSVVLLGFVLFLTAARGRIFCSALCPYGALASTLGAFLEGATVRGRLVGRLRALPRVVLVIAVAVAGVKLASTRGLGGPEPRVVEHGYRVAVVLGGMGFVGLACAPLLGPRIWCRVLCPLGGALDLTARRFPSTAVRKATGDCGACSVCSTACTMGIDVAEVVSRGDVTAAEGPCIDCGFCVDACPEGALELVRLSTGSRS